MDVDGEDAAPVLQAAIDEHGFLSWLDATVERVEEGAVELRVPHDEKLTNHGPANRGEVHGGIAATLIDTCGGVACRTGMGNPVEAGVTTIDLNVSYLRAALGDLRARADLIRAGETVGVATVSVESLTPDETVSTVAVGRGSYRLYRPD
ncbi:MAG: PaaI family thioesterase [Halobacteriaceae archaeon]